MVVYVLLYAALLPLGPKGLPADAPVPLVLFLAWRVSRGGWFSRGLLILATGLAYLAALLDLARAWDVPAFIVLVTDAVLLALVLSPPVYRRTHRDREERSGTPLAWPVPPAWLVLGAVIGGVIFTLCYLSSMDFQPVPGCGPQGATTAQLPDRCFTLARGYPLRFLSADQGIPQIDNPAMARDWTQWTVVSFSALYLMYGSYVSARTLRVPDPMAPVQPGISG
jgi:amino acid transporter